VSASESLLRLQTPFELREIAGAFVYVKGDDSMPSPRSFAWTANAERN
jgi:hypothetical protein